MIDLSKVEPLGCELTHQRRFKFPGARTIHTIRAGLDKDGIIWFSAEDIRCALCVAAFKYIAAPLNESHVRLITLRGPQINKRYHMRGINAAGLAAITAKSSDPHCRNLWQWYLQTVKPALLGDKAPKPDAQLTFDEVDKLDEVQTPAVISAETKANQRTFTFNGEYKIRAVLDDDRNIWLTVRDVFAALNKRQKADYGIGEAEARRWVPNWQAKHINWYYNNPRNKCKHCTMYALSKQDLFALLDRRERILCRDKAAIASQFRQWYLDVVEPAMLDAKPEVKPEAKKPDELIISKVKLQPCPECGTQPEIKACRVAAADGKPEHYCTVECPSCHFTVMERGTSPQQAMQRWNETADKLNEPKLKPCPHCGGDKVRVISACSCSMKYYVLCEKCFALFGGFDTPKAAAEAWNRRP